MKPVQHILKTKHQDHPLILPSNISDTVFDTRISFCLDNSYFECSNTRGPIRSPHPPSLYKQFVDDGYVAFRDKTYAETYLEYFSSLKH